MLWIGAEAGKMPAFNTSMSTPPKAAHRSFERGIDGPGVGEIAGEARTSARFQSESIAGLPVEADDRRASLEEGFDARHRFARVRLRLRFRPFEQFNVRCGEKI